MPVDGLPACRHDICFSVKIAPLAVHLFPPGNKPACLLAGIVDLAAIPEESGQPDSLGAEEIPVSADQVSAGPVPLTCRPGKIIKLSADPLPSAEELAGADRSIVPAAVNFEKARGSLAGLFEIIAAAVNRHKFLFDFFPFSVQIVDFAVDDLPGISVF